MKSTVDARAFADALKKLSRVLKSAAIPVIENIQVEFTEDQCMLTATDLDTWMIAKIPAHGDTFSFTLRNTVNVARACGYFNGDIQMELAGEKETARILMRCGGKTGEFSVDMEEHPPKAPVVDPQESYFVNARTILARVKRIKYATASIPAKPVLAGIHFHGTKLWCTDGYRAAISEDSELKVDDHFSLKADALQHLRAFGSTPVRLDVGARYAVFWNEDLSLYIRLLDAGAGPDLEAAWPKQVKEQYSIDRSRYLEAVKYLKEFSGGAAKQPAVFENRKVTFCGGDSKFSVELPILGECGIAYAFDLRYMQDALEQMSGSDTVSVSVSSCLEPILLGDGDGNTAMVLPVRLRAEWIRKAA